MLTNRAAQLLRAGKPAIGASVGSGALLCAEALALGGFDPVMVDCQHGAFGDQDALAAFRSIYLGGSTPFVRVEKNDFYVIGRMLDRGALGVVVPMVNSAADAREAARAMRYPPHGGRSNGPFATAVLGGNYAERSAGEVFLAVQIESAQAVERAEEILGTEGVDGCWIGPSDMALSMGLDLTNAKDQATHEAAILRVRDVCLKLGKASGISCQPTNAAHYLAEGFLFVTVGSDVTLLNVGIKHVQQTVAPYRR
jgi:4-hydroxy-2-oxoheptanedioate aldolase